MRRKTKQSKKPAQPPQPTQYRPTQFRGTYDKPYDEGYNDGYLEAKRKIEAHYKSSPAVKDAYDRGYQKGRKDAIGICADYAQFMQDKLQLIKHLSVAIESIEKWHPLRELIANSNLTDQA